MLVDFWAPWCGPCKALTPILNEIAAEHGDKVNVYKVNVDENTDLAQEHGVQSIPTIMVFKGGKISETIVGLKTKDELIEIINLRIYFLFPPRPPQIRQSDPFGLDVNFLCLFGKKHKTVCGPSLSLLPSM